MLLLCALRSAPCARCPGASRAPTHPAREECAHGEKQADEREDDKHNLMDMVLAGRQSAQVAVSTTLLNRGLYLEYLTLIWNVVGSAIIIGAAYLAGSVALAGFGIDSLIEIFASVVVVWQLRDGGKERERRALRFIGVAFLALAIY